MIKNQKLSIRSFAPVILFMLLLAPTISLAAPTIVNEGNGGLVPCGVAESNQAPTDANGNPTSSGVQATNPCGWNDLMALVNNVINFILYFMAIPIAAIMFAYAGFLMVTAGGEAAGARTKAKSIFTNAIIGLILATACWLIIKLILGILGYSGAWIGF